MSENEKPFIIKDYEVKPATPGILRIPSLPTKWCDHIGLKVGDTVECFTQGVNDEILCIRKRLPEPREAK